jgi:acetyl esterase/lipase
VHRSLDGGSPAIRRGRRLSRKGWSATLATVGLGCLAVLGAPNVWTGADSAPERIDVNVSYGPLPEQVLDVHVPSSGARPFPVVLYVHGGGWTAGSRADLPDLIRTLRPDVGVAVVSIDYRLVASAPDGAYTNTFPAASYDVDRAIRFVRANAGRWDLDPDHIIVAGISAGGQLAALAGVAPGAFTDPRLSPELARVSARVQGVIDYVGPSDFRTFSEASGWAALMTAELLGCEPLRPDTCDPARVAAASIATHLRASAPPAYLAYGEQDPLVSPATQGTPLATAWARQRGDLNQRDVSRRGVWYEQQANAGHNFDLSNSNYKRMERWLRRVITGSLK